jgi:hypothetical protein
VETELPVSTLAAVAGVGRTRASAVLKDLADLGVISGRQVGPTVLVRLKRANAAGQMVARLGGLRAQVIEEMRRLAGLQQRYAARGDAAGTRFWQSVSQDALTLAGADLRELIKAGHAAR